MAVIARLDGAAHPGEGGEHQRRVPLGDGEV